MKPGRVICYGRSYATDAWYCNNHIGINRLYYIHSGSGGCRHNGSDYIFQPRTLYLIPYTRDFEPYTRPGDPLLHTYVDLELLPPVLAGEILSADPTDSSMAMAALAVFDAGAMEYRRGDALSPLCKEAIIHLVSYLMEKNTVPMVEDQAVLHTLEMIHTRLQEPLTVEEMARACYLNKDCLIRRFARVVGTTPYAYLKNLRLHTARSLRAEGMSLGEIARCTGYSDASSLLHALKAF